MTSLPKRGDRVRVTEVAWGDPNPSMVGLEFTLDYEPRELKRTPGFFSHAVPSTDTRQVAVKVEILERAKTLSDAVAEFQAACPDAFSDFVPEEATEAVHPEFARGMRRAAAIAQAFLYGRGRSVLGLEVKTAIEKELK